jgi:predicted nucleic acid-binding protein
MNLKILVDSDFLIANYKIDDSSHSKSKKLAKKLKSEGHRFYCLNIVVQESTTVISKKMGMNDVRKFYSGLENFVDIFIIMDEKLESHTWRLFLKQTKKGSSFVDCANLTTLNEYKLDKIASFDKAYPKKLLASSLPVKN